MPSAADVAVRNMRTAGIEASNPVGRPPFVRFDVRAVEDRNASIEAGRFIGKDIVFALITPRGSKDVHEEVATEWLEKLNQEVQEGRFPQIWFENFRLAFKNFVAGENAIVDGTPLRDWPGIRPAQLRACIDVSILTVEDLAQCNEEAVQVLGMGGRALRESAKNWLQAAKDIGVPVAKIQALEADNRALSLRNESLTQQIQSALGRIQALEQAQSGGLPAPKAPSDALSDLLEAPAAAPKLKKI